MTRQEIASMIDHTILKAVATRQDVEKLCGEAKEYKFASVCVNPVQVPLAARLLAGSGVDVCTVVGFPLGATSSKIKAAAAAFILELVAPKGKPTTVQTSTPEPAKSLAAKGTCTGFTHTEANLYSFASPQSFSTSCLVATAFKMVWSIIDAISCLVILLLL